MTQRVLLKQEKTMQLKSYGSTKCLAQSFNDKASMFREENKQEQTLRIIKNNQEMPKEEVK